MPNKLSQKDYIILSHIARYCEEIEDAFSFFGKNEDEFKNNPIYRNAVSMPIQQIGELAKHLSENFISTHTEIPWKQIKGMRDWFAHQYLNMNLHVIWTTATEDLLPLRDYCTKILTDSRTNPPTD